MSEYLFNYSNECALDLDEIQNMAHYSYLYPTEREHYDTPLIQVDNTANITPLDLGDAVLLLAGLASDRGICLDSAVRAALRYRETCLKNLKPEK